MAACAGPKGKAFCPPIILADPHPRSTPRWPTVWQLYPRRQTTPTEKSLYVNLTPNRPTSGLSLDRYADLPISVVSEIAVIDSSRSREKQRIWKKWIYGRRMTPPRGPASSMPSRVPVERRNETKWLVSPREGAHNCHSLGQNGNPA